MVKTNNSQEATTRTPKTERVKVRLIDGEEAEVQIKRYLNLTEKYDIIKQAGVKTDAQGDLEFEAGIVELLPIIAEVIWADKNVTVADVEAGSLEEVIEHRLDWFLGSIELAGKDGSGQSSSSKKD